MAKVNVKSKTPDLSGSSGPASHGFLWHLGHTVRKNLVYNTLSMLFGLASHGYSLVKVRVDNNVFKLYTHFEGMQVIDEVMLLGQYREALKSKPRVVVDLGAHIGTFTLLAARTILNTYGDGLVIAVEPASVNYIALLNNIRLNRVEKAVHPIKAAIASELGWIEIEWIRRREKVKAVTMSEIIKRIREYYNCIDLVKILVKIDIEGAELDVLVKNNHWLKYVHSIVMELHPQIYGKDGLRKIISILKKNNFKVYTIEHRIKTKRALDMWLRSVNPSFQWFILAIWKTIVSMVMEEYKLLYVYAFKD